MRGVLFYDTHFRTTHTWLESSGKFLNAKGQLKTAGPNVRLLVFPFTTVRRLYVFLIFSIHAFVAAHASVAIKNVEQIRVLSHEQAAESRPVQLRGVVTVVWGWKASFFFQDRTAGISIHPYNGAPQLHSGDEIEVIGTTNPGKFAPSVDAQSIRILGRKHLPAPRHPKVEDLYGGVWDSQWISTQGLVRSVDIVPQWGREFLSLKIDIGAGTTITVRIVDFPKVDLDHLRGATINVQGVCGTTFNSKGQFEGLRLFVPSLDQVTILTRSPGDPFAQPTIAIDSILQFNATRRASDLVRIQGIVTYSNPEYGSYVQNGHAGILVNMSQPVSLPLGSDVEVVGYPGGNGYSPSLDDAQIRILHAISQPQPVPLVAPSEIIAQVDGFPVAMHDAQLIRVNGILRQVIRGTSEDLLILQHVDTTYRAVLPRSKKENDLPAEGSLIELTGICEAVVDQAREPVSFRIQLRSASDLVLLKSAPWWNADHAKAVVACLIAFALALACYLVITKRTAKLRELTLLDPLTGLYNRRGFAALAQHEWLAARRSERAILLFYIDLDHFKRINDTFGHRLGDEALHTIASVLRESFGKSGIVGRLGGDEFAALVRDTEIDAGSSLEKRLLYTLEQSNLRQALPFQLSLSVGALLCDESKKVHDIEELLFLADSLMYEQKRIHHDQSSQQP